MMFFWRITPVRETMQRSHRQLSPIGLIKDDSRNRHRDAPIPACHPCGNTIPGLALCRDAHDHLRGGTRATTSA